MQLILHFQTQPVLSKHSLSFFSPIAKPKSPIQTTIFVPKARSFRFPISLCHKTHTQNPILSAKKNKRRNGSQRLTRLLLQLMPIIASNFKMLPQPLDLVVQEICGGDRGGGGGGGWGMWRKGFGGGGFDGFGGKRKRKQMTLLYVLYGVLVICGLGLLIGGEIESNVFCWGLGGFGLTGVAMVHWWKIVAIFAVFLGGVLVGIGFKRDELQKLGLKIKSWYPVTLRSRRRRRSGRRAF